MNATINVVCYKWKTLANGETPGQSENPVAFFSPYAHNIANLNRKNGMSVTPLN